MGYLLPAAAITLPALLLLTPAPALPPGFADEVFAAPFEEATGLRFGPDGRLYVWEKAGRVWIVENGVRLPQPLIDLRPEVNPSRDFGLLGFALDPNFDTNGHFYLLYTVDHHHLQFFGTPQYDPSANDNFVNTIGRLTRYTATTASNHSIADPGSRLVLIGGTAQTGLPVCHQSHSVGSLVFAPDGTLMLSNGDGASYETVDDGGFISGSSNTALSEGIISPKEDVGAYRAQLVDSLSGKILRIDPATGNGIAGNPFFDPASPRAPRSRVWAMGLRNPFRFTLRPGTGSTDPAAGAPGSLYIGDAGWDSWEEFNIARGPATNFGWPIFEGCGVQIDYGLVEAPANLDAPNPLFNGGSCPNQHFSFRDLLVQDVQASPSWPNPCNPAQQIGLGLPRFEHDRPALDWFHGPEPARVPTFAGNAATTSSLGSAGCPVTGTGFGGNTCIGGAWYTTGAFPVEYHNSYFFADFGQGWLRNAQMDSADNLLAVRTFSGSVGFIVGMAVNPADGALYYINYGELGQAVVRRIRFTNNQPPTVAASVTPNFGPLPLAVQFSSAGTTDPEQAPLSFLWDFGDGSSPSTSPSPTHIYSATDDVTALGSITALVFSLSPPGPIGGGNLNPEVIRDGDYPPVGSQNSARQFDTFHDGDQGTDDWIGYLFAAPRRFTAVIFQEGKHFLNGGFFETLTVERQVDAAWFPVAGVTVSPLYTGDNGVSFETFYLSFEATPPSTGIRIRGNPGGSAGFISVGELRAQAIADDPAAPRRFDVNLTVTDAGSNTVTRTLSVHGNNSPPVISITSPIDGSLYHIAGGPYFIPLTAVVNDAEHGAPPGGVSCSWQTALHHNQHNHPETPDPACQTRALLSRLGCDGETYFWSYALTATTPSAWPPPSKPASTPTAAHPTSTTTASSTPTTSPTSSPASSWTSSRRGRARRPTSTSTASATPTTSPTSSPCSSPDAADPLPGPQSRG